MTETNHGRPIPCAEGNAACVCLPIENECVTSDGCAVSEECIKLYNSSQRSYCVPCEKTRLHGGQSRDSIIQVNGFASPSGICPGLPPSAPPITYGNNAQIDRGAGTFLDGCMESNQCSPGFVCISENNYGLPVACSYDVLLLSHSYPIAGCVCMWATSSVVEPFSRVGDDSMKCQTSDSCAVGMRCIKLFPQSQTGYCIPCNVSLLTKRVPSVIVVDGNVKSCQNPPPTSRNVSETEGDSQNIPNSAALTSCDGANSNCPDYFLCATVTNGGRLMDCRKLIADESLAEFYENKDCFCLNAERTCRDSLSCDRPVVANETGNYTVVEDRCYKLDTFSKQGFCISKHALDNRSPAPQPFTGSENNASDDDVGGPIKQASPSTRPKPTNETPVCIAVHALMDVPRHQLIYAQNRQASVLCDEKRNCATPGHIVTFEGRAMMMKSYCELIERERRTKVGCEKVVLHVNSVSMKRGRRIDSFNSQLKYTALAAAHESKFEEIGLTVLVYLGF